MISKTKYVSLAILIGASLLGYFVYASEIGDSAQESRFPFQFGLDIQGGAHLVYRADVSGIEGEREIDQRMDALRGLIEDRVNALGVSEPLVQVERGGLLGDGEHRLIVELPGVTDIDEAMAAIGETPVLEFLLIDEAAGTFEIGSDDTEFDIGEGVDEVGIDTDTDALNEEDPEDSSVNDSINDSEDGNSNEDTEGDEETENPEAEDNGTDEDIFIFTGLDGSMLSSAHFARNPSTGEPIVSLRFNREGRELFADITRENTGRQLAILLDGTPITSPVIREVILGGEAIISGNFTVTEARDLARRLQSGALPVPIEIVSTETVGATLGQKVLEDGVTAGVLGLILVAGFLIIWYRLSGIVAVTALSVYIIIMLSLFKLIPVTLTAAGIAGFILSIGMAVDANVIIFERMKEELRRGADLKTAVEDGFSRAWLSIRDANISSLITAVILYWFGTPLVQGFALVFFIGILISMVTAISVTRTFLLAITETHRTDNWLRTLFFSGVESKTLYSEKG